MNTFSRQAQAAVTAPTSAPEGGRGSVAAAYTPPALALAEAEVGAPGIAAGENGNGGVPAGPGISFHWLRLSIGSLVLAGLLALVLVIARVPGFARLIADPLFAKRCLVVHVDLALGVWLFAFLAAMASLLPVRAPRFRRLRMLAGPGLAVGGVLTMAAGTLFRGAGPVLANYVPVLGHPVYLAGIALLGAALLGFFLDRIAGFLFSSPLRAGAVHYPRAATAALHAAMTVFVLAMATLYISLLVTPRDLPQESYYELVFWGPGHLFQVVHLLGMAAAWIVLVSAATGRAPLEGGAAAALFAAIAAPAFIGPVLAGQGTQSVVYHAGFTYLMRWGTWPPVLILLAACAKVFLRPGALRGALSPDRAPYFIGFAASAGLALLGFVLGACIRKPSTLVPAHYHASVGAVTAAYMAMTYWLVRRHGGVWPAGARGLLLRWQPALYGAGQMVFALGFGFAGVHGAARKAYGQEQHLHSFAERFGMAVMGAGGLTAMAGGLLFLWLAIGLVRGARPGKAMDNPGGLYD